MNELPERLAYALAHPLQDPRDNVDLYRRDEPQPDGNLLRSILAVDR